MTKLQAGIISVSAATGSLNQVYEKSGSNLTSINEVLSRHQDSMHSTVAATGLNSKEVEKYYMALGRVPGALTAVVSGGTAAAGSMNMLTSISKMAAGTGREVGAVIGDLGTVFKNFGLTGEPALVFINRFSQLSNNLGIEFDDMKSSLFGAAESFKNLTDAGKAQEGMTEGLANMMNTYAGALMKTGMSGAHAADTVKEMAGAMSGLTIAQKAFISAQTGGPGGLLGNLQIEKMIRNGPDGIAQLQKKLMDTIQKQTGPIMSMDDALQGGQAGAARFEKQRMMITKGPLGQALGVKTSEDATRMLEAMKAMQEGRAAPTPLGEGTAALQNNIDKGNTIQERSYTEFTKMAVRLDAINRSADFLAAGFSAANFGIAKDKETNELSALQQARKDFMASGRREGGEGADKLANENKSSGLISDTSDASRGKAIVGGADEVKELFGMASDGVKKVIGSARSAPPVQTSAQKIAAARVARTKGAPPKPQKLEDAISNQVTQDRLQIVNDNAIKAALSPANQLAMPQNESLAKFGEIPSVAPGATLAQAQRATSAPNAPSNEDANDGARTPRTYNVKQSGPDNIEINVQVTSTSNQASTINNAKTP